MAEAVLEGMAVNSSILIVLPLILIVGGIAVMAFIFLLKTNHFHEHVTSPADAPGVDDQAALSKRASSEAFEANDDDSARKIA
jgi:hypothetical protein